MNNNLNRIKGIFLYSDSNLLEFFISISILFFTIVQKTKCVPHLFVYCGIALFLMLIHANIANNIKMRSLSLRLITAWLFCFIVLDIANGVFSFHNNYYLIEIFIMSSFATYKVGREIHHKEFMYKKAGK